MNKKTILGVVVVVIVILITVLVSGGSDRASGETVKIGVSLPLTGSSAFIGESINSGLQAALKDINSNGGIDGKMVELMIEDNKNLGPEGVSAFKALQLRNPSLVITTMSTPSVPLSVFAKDTGIPILATAVFADILSKNENAVSFFPTAQDDAIGTVEDLIKNRVSKVAVIYLNSEYGLAQLKAFTQETQKNGISIVASEAFLGDTTDFATPVAKALSTKTDAVYVIAINSVPVINQIKNTKKDITIYSNLIPLFGNLIYKSPQTFEGVHLTAPRVSIPGTPEYVSFRTKLNMDLNSKDTLGYAAVAYDDLKLIAEILNKDSDSKQFVKNFSGYGDFKGVSGDFSISGRNVGVKVYPVVIKDGIIQEVK
jgi:branched-chain amino acid transport system substrate-binding protein